MKRIHLLRVDAEPETFAALVEALRADGGRAGWLELGGVSPVPAPLEEAAGLGVLRAVAAGGGRTLALKPLRGEAVVDDLLREHFRGCRVVLVRGAVEAPLVEAEDGGWRVTTAAGSRRLGTDRLVEALRKPRPFAESAGS